MRFAPPLQSAILTRRYKRFLADIVTPSGESLTIHCPNTGAMTGCCAPGSRVWYSTSSDERRKYRHTLELVETPLGDFVGINSARANEIVGERLRAGTFNGLSIASIEREVRIPDASGRFDFRVRLGCGADCLVEVKSVTLARDHGIGAFPDTPSERARRHVAALRRARASGIRTLLVFCVQHTGVRCVTTAADVDPLYADALRAAHGDGVEVVAYGTRITPESIELDREIEVRL